MKKTFPFGLALACVVSSGAQAAHCKGLKNFHGRTDCGTARMGVGMASGVIYSLKP